MPTHAVRNVKKYFNYVQNNKVFQNMQLLSWDADEYSRKSYCDSLLLRDFNLSKGRSFLQWDLSWIKTLKKNKRDIKVIS